MLQQPYVLDEQSRAAVLAALRGLTRLAPAGRARQIQPLHAVVEAEVRPESIMNEFKAYSRELNRLGSDGPDRRRWARHALRRR